MKSVLAGFIQELFVNFAIKPNLAEWRKRKRWPKKLCDAIVKGMEKSFIILVMDPESSNELPISSLSVQGSDKQPDAIAESVGRRSFRRKRKSERWRKTIKSDASTILMRSQHFPQRPKGVFALEKLWGDAEMTESDDKN